MKLYLVFEGTKPLDDAMHVLDEGLVGYSGPLWASNEMRGYQGLHMIAIKEKSRILASHNFGGPTGKLTAEIYSGRRQRSVMVDNVFAILYR